MLPILIPEQHVWNQGAIRRTAGSQIKVEKPVIIDVAKISPHGHEDPSQAYLFGDIMEGTLPRVSVEFEGLSLDWNLQITACHVNQRVRVTGDKQIQPAVIVIIKKPNRKTPNGLFHMQLPSNIGERAISIVVIEKILLTHIGNV